MIEAGMGFFSDVRRSSWRNSFDQGSDENVGLRRKSGMQRTTGAIVTGTVRTNRRSRACRFATVVFSHAHGHLGANGHEHEQRQAANQNSHSRKPPVGSEEKVHRTLYFARRSGAHHLAKELAADITVDGQRSEKVGV